MQSELLHETSIEKLMTLMLTPKLKKVINKYKDLPEYKELELQVKNTIEEMDLIIRRLDRHIKEREELVKQANKIGWKIKPWKSTIELIKQIENRPGRAELLQKLKY